MGLGNLVIGILSRATKSLTKIEGQVDTLIESFKFSPTTFLTDFISKNKLSELIPFINNNISSSLDIISKTNINILISDLENDIQKQSISLKADSQQQLNNLKDNLKNLESIVSSLKESFITIPKSISPDNITDLVNPLNKLLEFKDNIKIINTSTVDLKFIPGIENSLKKIENLTIPLTQNLNAILNKFPNNKIEDLLSIITVNPIELAKKAACPSVNKLSSLIKKKNTLLKGLSQVQKMLESLVKTGKIVNTSLTALSTATTVIKVLPVPTSYPPGVGIPMGVINTLSSLLDFLADQIKAGKGLVGSIDPSVDLIKDLLGKLQQKFNELDRLLGICLDDADLTPEEKAALSAELNVSQDSSSTAQNVADTKALDASLEPNSNDPYTYKGWRFIIDKDIKNKFSFPKRRIIATKDTQKLFGEFSFSSSTDVLVEEMKFRIDNGGQTPKYYIGETIIE